MIFYKIIVISWQVTLSDLRKTDFAFRFHFTLIKFDKGLGIS